MLAERDLLAKDEAQRAESVKYVKDTITMVKELERPGDHHRPLDRRQGEAAGRARRRVAVGRRPA